MALRIGYCCSSEQFAPQQLIEQAQRAEAAGFQEILVSDHLQPWTPEQGHSSFIWALLGALGQAVTLPFCTGVTAPGARFHPVILAHAAATLAALYPGRFSLGLGVGEALNEHALGQYWAEPQERARMLLEAIPLIQRLLKGEKVRFQGQFFKVESLKLYSLPEIPPTIFVATAGPYLARQAGKLCDGLMSPGADSEKLQSLLSSFCSERPDSAPAPSLKLQLHFSWAPTLQEAQENARQCWPNGALNFPKGDLRYPEVIAEMAKMVEIKHFKNRVVISNRCQDFIDTIKAAATQGFTEVYLHNCGLNQAAFIDFCQSELFPELRSLH